jgi:hypothetical protein
LAAALVVDDEALSHLLRQLLREHAADDVQRSARRERNDHRDGFAGVLIRERGRRDADHAGRQRGLDEISSIHKCPLGVSV